MSEINYSMYFIGTDRPDNPTCGDIFFNVVTQDAYSWDGFNWLKIKTVDELSDKVETNIRILKRTNCRNCGAPLTSGDMHCKYCGTPIEYS